VELAGELEHFVEGAAHGGVLSASEAQAFLHAMGDHVRAFQGRIGKIRRGKATEGPQFTTSANTNADGDGDGSLAEGSCKVDVAASEEREQRAVLLGAQTSPGGKAQGSTHRVSCASQVAAANMLDEAGVHGREDGARAQAAKDQRPSVDDSLVKGPVDASDSGVVDKPRDEQSSSTGAVGSGSLETTEESPEVSPDVSPSGKRSRKRRVVKVAARPKEQPQTQNEEGNQLDAEPPVSAIGKPRTEQTQSEEGNQLDAEAPASAIGKPRTEQTQSAEGNELDAEPPASLIGKPRAERKLHFDTPVMTATKEGNRWKVISTRVQIGASASGRSGQSSKPYFEVKSVELDCASFVQLSCITWDSGRIGATIRNVGRGLRSTSGSGLRIGDRLLSINGVDVKNMPKANILATWGTEQDKGRLSLTFASGEAPTLMPISERGESGASPSSCR